MRDDSNFVNDDNGDGNGRGSNHLERSIPDKLNASDFTLYNTNPEMTEMFQMMLNRIQRSDPVGTALLKEQWREGGVVVMNPLDGVIDSDLPAGIKKTMEASAGSDFWSAEHRAIFWNPYSALQIYDNQGNIVGVDSADLAFVHEAAHSIDPLAVQHLKDKVAQSSDTTAHYPNLGEYLAGQYESMSAHDLGEHQRTNHVGVDVLVDNTSVHTAEIDCQVYWVKINESGNLEVGPVFDYQTIPRNWDAPGSAPKFGSPDPGHSGDYNHPSPHDENGGEITPNPHNHDSGDYHQPGMRSHAFSYHDDVSLVGIAQFDHSSLM